MRQLIALALGLIATPAVAQVEVGVRTEKVSYLAGEPIFIIVDIKNIGDQPVSYGADIQPPFTFVVANGREKPVRSLSPCSGPVTGSAAGGVSHPPMLKPGAQTTQRHLLRGYRLTPGRYDLLVSGHAGVRWAQYPALNEPPASQHTSGEPVAGADVDRTLPLVIVAGSQSELEAAYQPYVAIAMELYSGQGANAAQAIFEMAPAFLEGEMVKIVRSAGNRPGIAEPASAALAEVNSPSSRRELIAWFDRSNDLHIRRAIVDAIAKSGQPENLEFLSSLLPGRSTEADDAIRYTAALGIGRIGGQAAVNALAQAPESPNPLVTSMLILALGNTHDRSAVPVLIDKVKADATFRNEVCGALTQLTHYSWCDGSADVIAMQARWRRWWAANGAALTIYDNQDCTNLTGLPLVR